jgi:hypothetical protein
MNFPRTSQALIKATITIALAVALHPAFAAVGATGGLATAQQTLSNIQIALFGLVSVVALIYMIYLGVLAFTEKKTWADFGWGVVHVAAVGGAVALGNWAWALFSS